MGVEKNKFIMDDDETFYLVNGGPKRKTSEVKKSPNILGYKVKEDEMGKSADDLLQQALEKVSQHTHSRDCQQLSNCYVKSNPYSVTKHSVWQ